MIIESLFCLRNFLNQSTTINLHRVMKVIITCGCLMRSGYFIFFLIDLCGFKMVSFYDAPPFYTVVTIPIPFFFTGETIFLNDHVCSGKLFLLSTACWDM